MIEVRESKLEDIDSLLTTGLRPADLLEIRESGNTPMEALQVGFVKSQPCYTATVDGKPVAMFGVAPATHEPGVGVVWLLGTEGLLPEKFGFLRLSRPWLDRLGESYRLLGNRVHQDNLVHIQWLSWLGFTFLKQTGPFIEFARICDHV